MRSDRSRIVVGIHPVRELLRAGRAVSRVSIAASRGASPLIDDIRSLAAQAEVPVDEVDRGTIDERAEGLVHQGVVAHAPPFPFVGLDELLGRIDASGTATLLVAVDGVTDPHNLGSIARSAESFGAHGLLIPDRRAASITPTVEKSAAGALAHLPVVSVTNLVRTMAGLHDRGVWSIGLDADGPVDLADSSLVAEPCLLIVGAEGDGMARLTRERCDAVVRLPMRGAVASLNASVAAGVALYELARQRA